MKPSQQELDFKVIRCPTCRAVLFSVSAASEIKIRIKCRRCTGQLRTPVYVLIHISLEPVQPLAVDSNSENSASA